MLAPCRAANRDRIVDQTLTHLVLVREVVGIKGLRGEKPPEEKTGV